jgi:hypothetical protein
MFFQETTPDTSGYMIAGYVITFVIMGIYVASLYLRNRNFQQDITLLEELDKPEVKVQSKPGTTAKKRTGRPGTKKGRK